MADRFARTAERVAEHQDTRAERLAEQVRAFVHLRGDERVRVARRQQRAGLDAARAGEAHVAPGRLEELFDLQVTSVSQKPESLSQTAAAIHVVTQEDIRRMGVLDIPEALRNIPGVEVARVNSRDYAITARGFNGTVANKALARTRVA